MARTALATRPIFVGLPQRRRRSYAARRYVGAVARRARRGVRRSLPTMGVVLGGLAVGYADGRGFLSQLPAIGGSRMVTLGLVGWAATRFVRNPAIKAAGLAALGAAAYDFGRAQAGGTSGDDDEAGGGGGY